MTKMVQASCATFAAADAVPVVVDGTEAGRIPVADLIA
jgi:hypothetical protein